MYNNNDFFEWFKESDMYKQILEDYSPELIMLGGSRNMGVAKAKSDYDIVIYSCKPSIKYIHCPIRTTYNDCTVHGYVMNMINFIKMTQYELQSMESLFNWFELTTPTPDNNIIFITEKGRMFIDYLNSYRQDLIGLGIEAICRGLRWDLETIYQSKDFIPYDNKRFFHLLMAYQSITQENVVPLIKKIRAVSTAYLSDEDKEHLVQVTKFLYEYIQTTDFHRERLALLQMEELLWQLQQ